MPRALSSRLGFALIVALFAALALAACSSSPETNPAADPDPTTDVEDPARDDEPANADDEPAPDAGDEESDPAETDGETGAVPAAGDDVDDIDETVEDNEPDLLEMPRGYDNEFALGVLEDLSVGIGPRVRGTPGETDAADYLAQIFAGMGYEVKRQAFSLPFDAVSAVDLTVEGESVPATAFFGTSEGEVTGPIVAVPGLGSPADFVGIDVVGAIVLIERGTLFFQAKIDDATAAGAAGVLIYNNEAGTFDGSLETGSSIPAASLGRTPGVALRRQAGAGPINGTMRIEGGRRLVVSENIIASSVTEPCRLYVGGHYDSVPDVAGANDNASGTALVVELARAFAGVEGSELICFVAFAAEEAVGGIGGIAGSDFLVDQLAASGAINQVVAMLNLDVAAAGTNSVVLVGSTELAFSAAAIASELGIDARVGSLPANTGSDYLSFQQAGVPVLFPTIFGARIHVPEDNFDAVDPAILDSVGRLAHSMLQCLIVAAGGDLPSPAGCGLSPS